MSVLVEAISVVVPRAAIETRYPGGLEGYQRDCPNQTYCHDDNLTRVGFMVPDDVGAFIRRLAAAGFVHIRDGAALDLCVVDQHFGPTTACPWLDGGKHPDGYSLVWLRGTEPGALCVPHGWRAGQLTFVPSEEVPERLLELADEDGLETHLDFRTGKQMFVGRPSIKPPTPRSRPTQE